MRLYTGLTAGVVLGSLFAQAQTVSGWGQPSFDYVLPAGIYRMASGYTYSMGLKNDGTVAAPSNDVPAGLSGVVAISAGNHNLALKSDGSVIVWNDYNPQDTPPGSYKAVAAGNNYNVGLKTDGTVAGWESNGLRRVKRPPVPDGLKGVIAVAVGWDLNTDYALALKSNGSVVAWGDNPDGQTDVPAGLAGVVAIAAGSSHVLALKSDGTVVAWGGNSFGQASVPANLTGVIAVAAGAYHSVALRDDGTVVAWGDNYYGETAVPMGLKDVTAITAGYVSTFAIRTGAAPF